VMTARHRSMRPGFPLRRRGKPSSRAERGRSGACGTRARGTRQGAGSRAAAPSVRGGAAVIETVNPATGEVVERYEEDDEARVSEKLARAWSRWQDDWRHRPVEERLEVLEDSAETLEARRDELAMQITTEMGKPISAARAEVEKCAWLCRHYAEHSPSYLESERYDTDAERSYVRFDPLGPIFAIMPWNFPLWQVFRFAVPNLAAGNVGLLKHAASTTGCALAIEVLKRLHGENHPNTVYGVGTVQEEVGLRGAQTSAQHIEPDISFAVDVGIAGDTPGVKPEEALAKMGEGPQIVLYDASMIAHKGLKDFVVDVADEQGIPYQFDSLAGGGQDAGKIHLTGNGVPSLAITIATRYIHSHAAILHRQDFENAARLLTEVIKRLDKDTLSRIKA
jgi:hypothetical protein